jgi:hypothetical protein
MRRRYLIGAHADARGAAQVLDRGAHAVARGAARCASQLLHRAAEAVFRGAARCASQVLHRGSKAGSAAAMAQQEKNNSAHVQRDGFIPRGDVPGRRRRTFEPQLFRLCLWEKISEWACGAVRKKTENTARFFKLLFYLVKWLFKNSDKVPYCLIYSLLFSLFIFSFSPRSFPLFALLSTASGPNRLHS